VTNNTSGKVPTTAAPSVRTPRKVVWASFVGTALESYDFYVFAYFAAFFVGPLFFEPLGLVGATLAAFLTIAIAFLIRPVGALIFGWIGDRIGRRKTLLVTILIMGIATGLIGVLPDFQTAGWLGAALLIGLRLVQGLSLGGEWGGAVLLATEQLDVRRRPFWASFPQLGSPVGSILSGVLFLVMFSTISGADMVAWGWRIPFLTAFPLLLVSLYLRWSIDETPVFKAIESAGARVRVPIAAVFSKQPVAVIVAIGAALLGIGSYSLMNTYTVNYGETVLGYDPIQLLTATTIGGLLQLVTIPLFGWWASKIGSARVVAIGALGTLLVAFPIYFLLQFATFPILIGMMLVGGILPTLSWAALGGLMHDLFDSRFAYTALSFSYAIAASISGFIPIVTGLLGAATGNAWWHPGIVLAVLSAVTLVAAWAAARMRQPADPLIAPEKALQPA
jgi:MFS family permease